MMFSPFAPKIIRAAPGVAGKPPLDRREAARRVSLRQLYTGWNYDVIKILQRFDGLRFNRFSPGSGRYRSSILMNTAGQLGISSQGSS
jgi:hypothetical protein